MSATADEWPKVELQQFSNSSIKSNGLYLDTARAVSPLGPRDHQYNQSFAKKSAWLIAQLGNLLLNKCKDTGVAP